MEDRSKYYKKPFQFGAQKLYDTDLITKISIEHWEHFDNAVKTGNGFKIGDFIDLSVDVTANQFIKFLDEIRKMQTIEEVQKFCDEKIVEISTDVKQPGNEEV